MKFRHQATILLITSFWAAPAFAGFKDKCDNQTQCSSTEACIEANCLQDGNVNITLSWQAATDLDLHLELPDGTVISPDIDDKIEAKGGKHTGDSCFDDACGETRDSAHPYVEHITWPRDVPVVTGTYKVWTRNFSGDAEASFRILVEKPTGEVVTFSGSVGAVQKEESTKERFKIHLKAPCPNDKDTDGDGLCDTWETQGLDVNGDGVVDLDLPALGADPNQKDVFVEYDWMKGHRPGSMGAVRRAFASANVSNPNKMTGVRLHILRGEEITSVGGTPVTITDTLDLSDLQEIKFGGDKIACDDGEWFGSAADRSDDNCENISKARDKVFRCAVFGYSQTCITAGSSGMGDLPGNDFVVTLGSWKEKGTHSRKVATFMHELGHTLGLRHGGGDHTNCKPNYFSVMNYNYQFADRYADRPLDYSRWKMADLDESSLIEKDGVQGRSTWQTTIFGNMGHFVEGGRPNTAKDWDRDGAISTSPVAANITASDACIPDGHSLLVGHSDWSNMVFNFRQSADYEGSGISEPREDREPEMTEEQYEFAASSADSDDDGFNNLEDVCPAVADPDQSDSDGDEVGDACDRCPDEPAPGSMDGCPFDPNVDPENDIEPTEPTEAIDRERENGSADEQNPTERPDRLDVGESACSTTGSPTNLAAVLLLGVFAGFRRRRKRLSLDRRGSAYQSGVAKFVIVALALLASTIGTASSADACISLRQTIRAASLADSDDDGFNNLEDVCPAIADPDQSDSDGDGVGDACDRCPEEPASFMDGCPLDPNVNPDRYSDREPSGPTKPSAPRSSNNDNDNDNDNDNGSNNEQNPTARPDRLDVGERACSTTGSATNFAWLLLLGICAGLRRRRR